MQEYYDSLLANNSCTLVPHSKSRTLVNYNKMQTQDAFLMSYKTKECKTLEWD